MYMELHIITYTHLYIYCKQGLLSMKVSMAFITESRTGVVAS